MKYEMMTSLSLFSSSRNLSDISLCLCHNNDVNTNTFYISQPKILVLYPFDVK